MNQPSPKFYFNIRDRLMSTTSKTLALNPNLFVAKREA